ncbi:MAG TPA: deoxynucleoside kinase [Aggregatilinea sp.]|uniref:deoxynucleoside kinase n=1 Tax=Aggregatilinea sp. TaxID=2806333 RepID=UPI002B860452|nr:deoxynucleoside kinase [Aggregatilinea sp.]HML23092.1 deoxynucleoside kinase [Aggregatilinea sp.]
MNTTSAYIAVEGVIGVGKTTLARAFQKESGARLVLEVFEENPFLSDFYGDRSRYAFQTQIFFLLSRYHQQRQLAALPRPIISDYIFQKDRLFAEVNLAGDEFQTYLSVHEALAENVPQPDLIVFLTADTATLMNRITARDRPYERNMDPDYIDSLRVAYEHFFSRFDAAPVLTIDTNQLDFVRNPEDRETIFARIRGALGEGPSQPALPGLESGPTPAPAASARPDEPAHRLSDLQRLHSTERALSSAADPALSFLLFQEEVGHLARAFAQRMVATQSGSSDSAPAAIRAALASVLGHIIRLANDAGIDLEEAYVEKLLRSQSLSRTDAEGNNA